MASRKEKLEKEIRELEASARELKARGVEGYEKIIDRLEDERNNIRNEINHEYKEARRYVRSNPEEGVLAALVGGFALGLLFGRIFK